MGAGEFASLGTAICWTVTVMSFEIAGKRVGSLPVNILRLLAGLIFLSLYSLAVRGEPLPIDADASQWFWLGLSGFVGFVIGDLCLFRAFILIGSRISMVIYAMVPPITAVSGWMLLGETLSLRQWSGIMVTVTGICMVILVKGSKRIKLAHPTGGILLALGGTVAQAIGLVLSKLGMGQYNAFAATQIRIITALAVFVLILPFTRLTGRLILALRDRRAMKFLALGSFFGPFLGVWHLLVFQQQLEVGVASTIMAMVPAFVILPEVLIMGKKVRLLEVLGAVVVIAGVGLVSL